MAQGTGSVPAPAGARARAAGAAAAATAACQQQQAKGLGCNRESNSLVACCYVPPSALRRLLIMLHADHACMHDQGTLFALECEREEEREACPRCMAAMRTHVHVP